MSLQAATEEVAGRDPVLADLIARIGPIRDRTRDPDGPFGALVRAIVFQQLAGRSAQAIYGRMRATVGDTLTPESLNAVSDTDLRTAGLSQNKLLSLRDLSDHEAERDRDADVTELVRLRIHHDRAATGEHERERADELGCEQAYQRSSSATSARMRPSSSSRMRRTVSRSCPAGSSSSQSAYFLPG